MWSTLRSGSKPLGSALGSNSYLPSSPEKGKGKTGRPAIISLMKATLLLPTVCCYQKCKVYLCLKLRDLSLVRSLYIVISLSDKVTGKCGKDPSKPKFQVVADQNSEDLLHLSHYFGSRDKMCYLTRMCGH